MAVALQQGNDKVVQYLLDNDSRSKVRLPALHIAAKKDDVNAASLLIGSTDDNVDHQSAVSYYYYICDIIQWISLGGGGRGWRIERYCLGCLISSFCVTMRMEMAFSKRLYQEPKTSLTIIDYIKLKGISYEITDVV